MRFYDPSKAMVFQYVLPEDMKCDHPKVALGMAGYGNKIACPTCKTWTWMAMKEPEVSLWTGKPIVKESNQK